MNSLVYIDATHATGQPLVRVDPNIPPGCALRIRVLQVTYVLDRAVETWDFGNPRTVDRQWLMDIVGCVQGGEE